MARRESFAALFVAVLLSLMGLVGLAQPAVAAPVVVTQADLDRAASIMSSGVRTAA